MGLYLSRINSGRHSNMRGITSLRRSCVPRSAFTTVSRVRDGQHYRPGLMKRGSCKPRRMGILDIRRPRRPCEGPTASRTSYEESAVVLRAYREKTAGFLPFPILPRPTGHYVVHTGPRRQAALYDADVSAPADPGSLWRSTSGQKNGHVDHQQYVPRLGRSQRCPDGDPLHDGIRRPPKCRSTGDPALHD